MALSPLLVVTAAAVAPQLIEGPSHNGEFGWHCSAIVQVDGYSGSVSRNFGPKVETAPYMMELRRQDGGRQRSVVWSIDPRPNPPPQARAFFLGGRREADAFKAGPDYIHIDFEWRAVAVGPVWAHYWGDGSYAGADMLMTRRQASRSTLRDGTLAPLSGGLAQRTIIARLAPKRRWTVIAADATGKQLFSESFEMPSWDVAEAEFRRAKSQIDALELIFRRDHQALRDGNVSCTDEEHPLSSI
jgi:hypothetical protein